MVGDISSAVDLVQLDSSLDKQVIAGKDVGTMRVSSQGEHRWMFQKEKGIPDKVLFASRDDLLLDGEGLRIGDASESEKVYVHLLEWNVIGTEATEP